MFRRVIKRAYSSGNKYVSQKEFEELSNRLNNLEKKQKLDRHNWTSFFGMGICGMIIFCESMYQRKPYRI